MSAMTESAATSSLRIGHLAVGRDTPRPDRVVVIIIIVAAHREQFGQGRLDVAGLVNGTALDDCRFAVPVPRQSETGQRPRQHRLLQLRFLPALAVVDGYIDTPDPAVAAPGDAADLVEAGPLGTTQETDEVRGRLAVRFFVVWVCRAFEEIDVGLRGKAPDVLHGEDQGLVDQAMKHQPMLRWIDGGDAGVMAFIKQSVRRDDAVELLERRSP